MNLVSLVVLTIFEVEDVQRGISRDDERPLSLLGWPAASQRLHSFARRRAVGNDVGFGIGFGAGVGGLIGSGVGVGVGAGVGAGVDVFILA